MSTAAPPALLAQADALLADEAAGAARRQAVRIACWLTRSALEQQVVALLAAKGWDVGDASMRTALSCLEAAYADDDPELVARAEYAWAALSRVCHQHAYELAPTVAEARHLRAVVAELGTYERNEVSP